MIDIMLYLKKHYYEKYKGVDVVPDDDCILRALDVHRDKVIAVYKDGEVVGVAIFLTLSDTTYYDLEAYDMNRVEVIAELLKETGDNIHFILLTAQGYEVIKFGIKKVKEMKPKTVSWWNPEMTKLHRYNMN